MSRQARLQSGAVVRYDKLLGFQHRKGVLHLWRILMVILLFAAACQPEVVQQATPTLSPPAETTAPTSAPATETPLPSSTPLPVNAITGQSTPTLSLPVTSTLPPITLVFPPTATAEPCVPREDWQATYTIQPGDTLFAIGSLFGLTTADLQLANCIADANNIFSGTTLRVPFSLEDATTSPTTD